LLSITNRHLAETLLDAAVLSSREDSQDAIIFVETGRPDVHVSRRAFLRESLIRAGRLKSLGIGRGDLVVIAHTQNLESIFAFWGALLAGAMPSMFPTLTEKLDPEVYMSSMAELVKLSEVRAVLTTDEFAPQLAGVVECEVIGSSPFSSPKGV